MSVLACQDLAFSYDGKDVLKGVNFTLKQGEYLCIVGENGSGKTTLMKGLLRLNKHWRENLSVSASAVANTLFH